MRPTGAESRVRSFQARIAAPALALVAAEAWATPAPSDYESRRGALEELYHDELVGNNDIYESAPVTHIAPSLKTVTFALAGVKHDVEITDRDFGGSSPGAAAEQTLKLTGYSIAPYLAISLERIGLGFGVESGARALDYKAYDRNAPDAAAGYARRQRSEIDYRAVGAYVYLLPYASKGERPIIASTVIGAKQYSVKAKVTPVADPAAFGRYASYRYSVTEYEAGFLVEFRLLKKFSLMPWVDYTYVDAKDAVTQGEQVLASAQASEDAANAARVLIGDTKVVWQSRPRIDIGLDLVVRVAGVALHLGELFGYIVDQRSHDQFQDKGYYLSASFDMRGN